MHEINFDFSFLSSIWSQNENKIVWFVCWEKVRSLFLHRINQCKLRKKCRRTLNRAYKKSKRRERKNFIKTTSSMDEQWKKKCVKKKRHGIQFIGMHRCMISANSLSWKRITTRCNNNSPVRLQTPPRSYLAPTNFGFVLRKKTIGKRRIFFTFFLLFSFVPDVTMEIMKTNSQ